MLSAWDVAVTGSRGFVGSARRRMASPPHGHTATFHTPRLVRCPLELLNHAADASKPCDLNSSSRRCSNARLRESSLIAVLPRAAATLGRVRRPCRTYCPFRSPPRTPKCRSVRVGSGLMASLSVRVRCA